MWEKFHGPDSTPLSEVRDWVLKNQDDGCICPSCDQLSKIYKRKMDSGQAHDLIRLYLAGADKEFVKLSNSVIRGHDIAKLRYWGLVVEGDAPAHWMITKEGVRFVRNITRVPKRVILYDSTLLGFDTEEMISIVDALADKFDYNELMSS